MNVLEGSHLVFKQGGKCPVCERNRAVAKGVANGYGIG